MNRQQISVIDMLTFILFIPFIVFVFSATGWLLLRLVTPTSDQARPELVRIRHTLPPLRPVTSAPAMAVIESAPAQLEPAAIPAEEVQSEPEVVVDLVGLMETRVMAQTPVEQPPAVAPQPASVVANVESTSMGEVALQPVVVAETEPVPQPSPVTVANEQPIETQVEAAAPIPTATPLPPLFDPSSPPDVSFFDQLLEQVSQ